MFSLNKISLLAALGVFFISLSAQATTFIPTPIQNQLRDSHAVIKATFIGNTSKRLPSGEVVTQASFSLASSVGLKENDTLNKNEFAVLIPGGEWQGVQYHVKGAPSFNANEEVVLLLDRGPHGYSVKNMAMGKFNLFKHGGEKYLQSGIFSERENYGRISWKNFSKLLVEKFNKSLELSASPANEHVSIPQTMKHDHKGKPSKQKREPSSLKKVSNQDRDKRQDNATLIGLILILAGLGFFSAHKLGSKR